MTEADWLTCNDPTAMLEFLERRATDRKLRLFGVACCRRVWNLMTDSGWRNGVEAAERFAEGLLAEEEFERALQPASALWVGRGFDVDAVWDLPRCLGGAACHLTSRGIQFAPYFIARACLPGEWGRDSRGNCRPAGRGGRPVPSAPRRVRRSVHPLCV